MKITAILLAATSLMAAPAYDDWRVNTLSVVDVSIRAAVDTAHGEPSWCLGVDVDKSAKTVTIWQAVPATLVGNRQTRGTTTFSCPAGTGLAHGHFLSAGHVDGPSPDDLLALKRLRAKPPVAVVIVIDSLKNYRVRLYHVD